MNYMWYLNAPYFNGFTKKDAVAATGWAQAVLKLKLYRI